MERRDLQFLDNTSRKFWSICLDGCSHVVQFGRIGTAGQTQTKEFATEEAARKSYEKLVQEKLRKGYVDAGTQPAGDALEGGQSQLPVAAPAERDAATRAQRTEPAAGSAREPAPPSVQSNAVAVSLDTPRSIDLEPVDEFWVTWRPWTPLQRPEPAPFDLREAAARLAGISTSGPGREWDWSQAAISPGLSREEALFWYMAIMEAPRKTPRNLAAALARRSFTGALALEQVTEALWSRPGGPSVAELFLPLVNLLPASELIDRFLRDEGARIWSSGYEMTQGLRSFVLAYLSPSCAAGLRDRLRPLLDPAGWPVNFRGMPRPAYYLAAHLGMHAETRALVESWPDDLFAREDRLGDYFRVQEIVFGLGDPRLVEYHMRRLKLRLCTPEYIRAWLAHTQYAALDWIHDSILAVTDWEEPERLVAAFGRVHAPEAAALMLELMLDSQGPRAARLWLDANPAHVIAGLAPVAGGRGRLADGAAAALRACCRKGYADLLRTALAREAPEVAERVQATVLDVAAKQLPQLDAESTPEWLREAMAVRVGTKGAAPPVRIAAEELPQILVGERGLNGDQVARVLAALSQSTLEAPLPLVTALKAHADPTSLEAFAWRLFEMWLHEGASAKEKWAMAALGLLGRDGTALKLTPLIRAWPGENHHARAVFGLECLRAIGTDTALMQINGVAQKVPFKGLKAKAMECMEAIAQDRGFTRAQLEDRIVPDCDLDARGSREFDFGPRRFRFVLGPGMKPMVRDEAGKVRPDLPTPTTKDDAAAASQAVAEWRLLKKQVAAVAKIQAVRLEQAMVTERHWSTEEFTTLFAHHPLMTNLVRLLVWAAYDSASADRPAATFRVTEDLTYADAADESFALAPFAGVGIVHPLHLAEAERVAWGELLSDYEIVPPFPQLGRPVHHLAAGEAEQKEITRYATLRIPALALVGTLERLGWARGGAHDAGFFYEHSKQFPGASLTAVVEYEEGIPMGYMEGGDDQPITRCFFIPGCYRPENYAYPEHANRITLGEVDAVVVSEVLADLAVVAAKAK